MAGSDLIRLLSAEITTRRLVGLHVDRALTAWTEGDESTFEAEMREAQIQNDTLPPGARVDLWHAQYDPHYLRSLTTARRDQTQACS